MNLSCHLYFESTSMLPAALNVGLASLSPSLHAVPSSFGGPRGRAPAAGLNQTETNSPCVKQAGFKESALCARAAWELNAEQARGIFLTADKSCFCSFCHSICLHACYLSRWKRVIELSNQERWFWSGESSPSAIQVLHTQWRKALNQLAAEPRRPSLPSSSFFL